ncbi:hydrolase activity protein [[Candida] boidinii]|nr:hydrolase activity protein [[Candida] boidinii]
MGSYRDSHFSLENSNQLLSSQTNDSLVSGSTFSVRRENQNRDTRRVDERSSVRSVNNQYNSASNSATMSNTYTHSTMVTDPPKLDYSKITTWQSILYKLLSAICCLCFLNILMFLALLKTFYDTYIDKKHLYQKREISAYPKANNKKIPRKTELSYYVELLGYKLLKYIIITEDGFALTLQRLVHSDGVPGNSSEGRGRPILLVHGLLQSSGSFITSGEKSLAVQLFKKGYDVWLGNNRCGFEPQNVFMSANDPQMWKWDIREMAKYDLPLMIDEIIKATGFQKISLCCHSQGTTQTFIALSKQYNIKIDKKVDKFIALAPAVFGGPLLHEKLFIRFINSLPPSLYNIFFGINSFMPILMTMRTVFCRLPFFGLMSYSMFNFLFDWNDFLWDKSIRDIHFLFSPVYVSSQHMKWWLSKDGFVDSGSILSDTETWFGEDIPDIMLVIGGTDRLVDGRKIAQHVSKLEPCIHDFQCLVIPEYAHLDVLWADDVQERIGNPMLDFLSR